MAYEIYTIQQFMDAWFNNSRDVIKSEEEFAKVYSEYIDTSGLYITEEFDKMAYITFLENRINTIELFIYNQERYYEDFGVPYFPAFEIISKYGHKYKWDGNGDAFLKFLLNVKTKETKYKSLLSAAEQELDEIRSKNKKDKSLSEGKKETSTRHSFIRMMNSLCQNGFSISKKDTTVEELSLMIKQQLETSTKMQ